LRRYIFTGAPGAGKTALLDALSGVGYPVVREAATDVIAQQIASGVPEPWTDSQFLSDVLRLQIARQAQAESAPVVLFDRSPICTLALARYSDRPVSLDLSAEVDRLIAERVYERDVFLMRPLGFIERTAARRITCEDALVFEAIHETTYTGLGFNLIEVLPASLHSRVAAVRDTIEGYAAGRT
jgi:predicted ATPase